ncbi:MAG: sugar ABC transporter substrate-binding protein [Chloroflexota bacterium]|nr:MAG: sugar ABC transporter substrate-binding protein [Chloroflexota bacterium]
MEALPWQSAAANANTSQRGAALSGKIYMLVPNRTSIRWELADVPEVNKAAKKYAPNMQVVLLNADNDASKQVNQVDTAISQGAKAIILASVDATLAGGMLKKIKDAGIPVVSYEHDAYGGPLDYLVTFDARKTGEIGGKWIAEELGKMPKGVRVARLYGSKGTYWGEQIKSGQDQYILPLVQSGQINVVAEDYVEYWAPATAQKTAEQFLTRFGDKIDAFIASNESTAGGAIAALMSRNLAGKIPVYGGQDATVPELQYVMLGYQKNAIAKYYAIQADAAVKLVIAAVTKTDPPAGLVNDQFDNEFMKVPAARLPAVNITIDNVGDVVKAGMWTWDDLCKGPAANTKTCKERR